MEEHTPRNPQQTRAALLEAAFKEIYENGYQAASLERILANTNLTKGALYHHFPNKHALGIAVIREVITEQVIAEHAGPLTDTDDPIPVLLAHLDRCSDESASGDLEHGCPLHNLVQEMSPLDEDFRRHLQEIQFTWQRILSEALARGQANGNVRKDLDRDEVALFLVAAVEGCKGTTKSLQSFETFRSCMNQLKRYVETLRP